MDAVVATVLGVELLEFFKVLCENLNVANTIRNPFTPSKRIVIWPILLRWNIRFKNLFNLTQFLIWFLNLCLLRVLKVPHTIISRRPIDFIVLKLIAQWSLEVSLLLASRSQLILEKMLLLRLLTSTHMDCS